MAEELVGPSGDHFVVEVAVRQVRWLPSEVATRGGGAGTGPRTRHGFTLTKVVTSATELEAAVAKAQRVLEIEVGSDA